VFADGSTTRPPGSTEIRQVDFTEGLKVGYRWYDSQGIEPLFPFGYGLSYTRFKYSKLTTKLTEDGYDVTFTLTNKGKRAGAEVAQVYVGAPASPPAGLEFMPKSLGAFARVTLEPGESSHVHLHVPYRSFEYWSVANSRWEPALGARSLYVGASSRDLPLQATINVGPPALGSPGEGSATDENATGMAEAFRTVATKTGTVKNVRVLLAKKSTVPVLVAGIYADNDAKPGALLAQGKLNSPQANAWNEVSLPTTTIESGKPYWIAVLGVGRGKLMLRDECCEAVGSQPTETSLDRQLTALPSVWATGARWEQDGPLAGYAPFEGFASG
jgi:hypothetical protein